VPSAVTDAPISWSGSVTRRIGRERSESSPVSVLAKGRVARSPSINRAVVPLLPQSSVSAGAVHAEIPPLRTRISPPSAGISGVGTPRERSTLAVLRQSAPGRRSRIRLSPFATPASIRERWLIDLSPGMRMSPLIRNMEPYGT
jgi:hypothetical protein